MNFVTSLEVSLQFQNCGLDSDDWSHFNGFDGYFSIFVRPPPFGESGLDMPVKI